MADTDIITLAEAKDILEVDGTDHDPEISAVISAASQRLDDLCGPVVARTVTGELHDGGGTIIRPRFTPIFSVTTVKEYSDTTETVLTAETNQSKPSDGYLVDGPSGGRDVWIRRRGGNVDVHFDIGRRNVEITYEAGRFATTATVDEKFKRAAGFLVTHLWKTTAPAWFTNRDFFDEASPVPTPAIPSFGIPNVVRQMLQDEIRPPAVA